MIGESNGVYGKVLFHPHNFPIQWNYLKKVSHPSLQKTTTKKPLQYTKAATASTNIHTPMLFPDEATFLWSKQ